MVADHLGGCVAKKERSAEEAAEKDREKWMARFQVRLAMQPGVDRTVVLQAVKEVTAHCADTGRHPRTAYGDPDAHAAQAAARLVPADRAARGGTPPPAWRILGGRRSVEDADRAGDHEQ
ncbi:hypothetical protein ACGFT2_33565 [Streptomyces sp. NPDC048514]|uniref:hypothetical protein n=1 Tax=Streptomyces sp. NPDC048514 TaxID=3365564 RepID=UPI003722A4A8